MDLWKDMLEDIKIVNHHYRLYNLQMKEVVLWGTSSTISDLSNNLVKSKINKATPRNVNYFG